MAYYDDDYYDDYDRPTYDNYNGSYAQDVEGYDDDTIDDSCFSHELLHAGTLSYGQVAARLADFSLSLYLWEKLSS